MKVSSSSSSLAGLTCIRGEAGSGADCERRVCVLQLTEAGDVFYQVLEQTDSDRPAAAALRLASDSQSDDEVIGPTQTAAVPETPEHQREDSDWSEESVGRGQRFRRTQLQVFVNDDPDVATAEGGEAGAAEEEEEEEGVKRFRRRRRAPAAPGGRTLHTWKVWLQKLMQRSSEKELDSQLLVVQTRELLQVQGARAAQEEQEEELLRRELRSSMSSRSLLLRAATSDPAPLPSGVDPAAWRDALSQRLSASWQGEEAWRAWWHEHLGLNRKSKLEALRRRRRREKEARRAAGRQPELSGSFTSSISYQAELDDFSSSGWSSAASQGAWSDQDDLLEPNQPKSSPTSQGSATPSHILTDPLVPTLTPSLTPSMTPSMTLALTPSLQKDLKDHPAPSVTELPETPQSSVRRSRRPLKNLMDTLLESQVRCWFWSVWVHFCSI